MANIVAAGAVVLRRGPQVLLVHRPKYDDWSFPKGKVDRGEHLLGAAVREVAEETGLHVRLGPPLPDQEYTVGNRTKCVHYWSARVVGDDDVEGYHPNDEIDQVRWVALDDAPALLTYERDRETLGAAIGVRKKTRALVVLRHGKARARSGWSKPDRFRPLLARGADQAQRLVPLLAAYDITRVVSSDATRCLDTVAPFSDVAGRAPTPVAFLSEEGADDVAINELVADLLGGDEGALICSHRPVLPTIIDAAGLAPVALEPGELLVVHHRKRRVVAVERHLV